MKKIKSLISYIKSIFYKKEEENGIYKWPICIQGYIIKQKNDIIYIDGYEMLKNNRFKRTLRAFIICYL